MTDPSLHQTHIVTPLLESIPLSRLMDSRVWLKMEALQPSGSFKDRGVGTACIRAVRRGATSLVASSGGNAGMAVAWAARQLRVPATIAVPSTTAQLVRDRLSAMGARVLVKGDVWDEAHAWASRHAEETGAAYVSPFDHPDIWDGHSTLVAELQTQLAERGVERPGAVVLSVGGGGLLCGVLQGMEQASWGSIPVHCVETRGAASLAASVAAGALVELPAIRSIAKTLGARKVARRALELTMERDVRCVQVTDRQAASACSRFLNDHRLLVEPSCGAALAVVYSEVVDSLKHCQDVVLIVCGGTGVTRDMLVAWERETGTSHNR